MADNTDTNNQKIPSKQDNIRLVKTLWQFFSAMKTAIILIVILVLISIPGTLIQQNLSPDEYIALYGSSKYAFIKHLYLNDVYNAWYYKLFLTLIGINLFVCSIARFKSIWRHTFSPDIRLDADNIAQMQHSATYTSTGTVNDITDKITVILRAKGYKITKNIESTDTVMLATKGRIALWGAYLTHLSILLIFVGAIIGKTTGFNGFTRINEGSYTTTYSNIKSLDKESDLGFKVGCRKFEIKHDAQGNPTAYRSDLQVYDGDHIAVEKVIDVNSPLSYRGVSFYQSDYGLAGIKLKITGPDGQIIDEIYELDTKSGPDGKMFEILGEPFRQISIGGKHITLFMHNLDAGYDGKSDASQAVQLMVNDRFLKYKGLDAWTDLGWLDVGQSKRYKNIVITLENVIDYTDLQVSSNPGLSLIFSGFALLLAGVFISFYISCKTIRIGIYDTEQGIKVIVGASCKNKSVSFDSDFEKIQKAVS